MDYSDFFNQVLEETDKVVLPRQTVWFDIERGKTDLYDNKIGGTPYFPKNMEYPKGSNNQPLVLLAQLNFDTIPHIEPYPKTGILQFFITPNDIYGLNWDNLDVQKDFRVIYHSTIADETQTPPEIILEHKYDVPFVGEYKLIPNEITTMVGDASSETFVDEFVSNFNKMADKEIQNMFGSPLKSIMDLDDGSIEELCQRNSRKKAHIGGYPHFTQYDPRDKQRYSKYDLLLFELDSIHDKKKNIDIMWGDCGIGNFFISQANLKECNFSEVLYNYDCY